VAFILGPFAGRMIFDFTPSEEQVSQFMQGLVHLSIQTLGLRSGGIRGQILPGDPVAVPSSFPRPSVLWFRCDPNPMTDQTTLRFNLPTTGMAQLTIFDLQGRVLRRLARGPLPGGEDAIVWDGRTDGGEAVRSGVYYARLVALGASRTIKLTLMR
jgi:hypothetical protein